jgi:hypothetical protein
MGKTNPNFVNGVPELLILQLLATKEMYGYELVKAIQSKSGKIFNFALPGRKEIVDQPANGNGRKNA